MRQYIVVCVAILAITFDISAQYVFTVDKSLQYTPIEDQQATNTCWSFATNSFLESELMRNQKTPMDLSEMYIVRSIYLDKAQQYILSKGKSHFAEGGLSHDVIHAISTYGAIPEEMYPGKENHGDVHNHAELVVVMKSVLNGMLSSDVVSEKWDDVINAILDVYLGPVPEKFTIAKEEFTPITYAKSLGLNTEDYVSITSFTHHPFYGKFVLDIPDNHAHGEYYNVPLEEFMTITKNALKQGYTVAWDGDVSESAFSWKNGLAVIPESERTDVFDKPGKEKSASQEERQQQFDLHLTTDDHLMHITGTAHDQEGNNYFVVKNSWGNTGAYTGILYMSEPYFLSKTIAVMVHRDAIPSEIAAKLVF